MPTNLALSGHFSLVPFHPNWEERNHSSACPHAVSAWRTDLNSLSYSEETWKDFDSCSPASWDPEFLLSADSPQQVSVQSGARKHVQCRSEFVSHTRPSCRDECLNQNGFRDTAVIEGAGSCGWVGPESIPAKQSTLGSGGRYASPFMGIWINVLFLRRWYSEFVKSDVQGHGSMGKVPAAEAWRQEFRSKVPTVRWETWPCPGALALEQGWTSVGAEHIPEVWRLI